jgi:pyruvate-formate lyase-activating enzyme
MKINKIINFSCVDGPGNRLVVFFQGCNFNCIYCHNPETIDYDSEGRFVTAEALFEEILPAKDFISGVTFSGGECSLQYEEIYQVATLLKAEGINVFLDTNFSLDGDIYERLAEVVDSFIVDLKAYDDHTHQQITQASNKQILENITHFYDKIYEVRTVVVSGYNDSEKQMTDVFKFIVSIDPILPLKLIAFRPYGVRKPYDAIVQPSNKRMQNLQALGESLGLKNIYYK